MNEDLIKEADAFLKLYFQGQCPTCDLDVGYICEFCQSLDVIKRLRDGLKK